jgi:hypothetical protein
MLITKRARTSRTMPRGLNTIIAMIRMRAHHSGTHCVPPFIIGFHGRYVSQLDEYAAHCVWFCAIAALLSCVEKLELQDSFSPSQYFAQSSANLVWTHSMLHVMSSLLLTIVCMPSAPCFDVCQQCAEHFAHLENTRMIQI